MASLTKERRKNPTTGKLADYWKVAYREGTSQRREALGFLNEKDAARAFEQWKARRVLGLATAPATAPSSSSDAGPTLREWWGHEDEAWPPPTPRRMYDWVMAQGRADKTVQSANSARRAFLPLFGDKPLRAVTVADGDTFVRVLRERGRSSRTAEIYLGWMQRSLEVAAKDGLLEAAPRFNAVAGNDRRTSPWATPAQMERLYEELDRRARVEICSTDATLAIRTAETLFMRSGEVCTRRWSDLNRTPEWTSATLAIRPVQLPDGTRWTPKNRESTRTVPVPPTLLGRLRDHWVAAGQPRDGWIFRGRNPDSPLTSFKKTLASACVAIELPQILNPHALRHTGATRMAFAGVERRTVMKIGGWKTGEMLDEIYEHTSDDRAAEVLTATEVGGAGPTKARAS